MKLRYQKVNAYCLLDATSRFDLQQDGQCACNVTLRRMRAMTVAVEKQYKHSECVLVALGLQHAVRMSHTTIYCLSGSTEFFHIISGTELFSKNKLLDIKFVFLISLQQRILRDMITNLHRSSCKGKGKAIPLQAWTGPKGSRRMRLPDFKKIGT